MFSQINCLYNVESISEAENGHSGKEMAFLQWRNRAGRCVEAQIALDVSKYATYFSHCLSLPSPGDGRGSDRMELAQAGRYQGFNSPTRTKSPQIGAVILIHNCTGLEPHHLVETFILDFALLEPSHGTEPALQAQIGKFCSSS